MLQISTVDFPAPDIIIMHMALGGQPVQSIRSREYFYNGVVEKYKQHGVTLKSGNSDTIYHTAILMRRSHARSNHLLDKGQRINISVSKGKITVFIEAYDILDKDNVRYVHDISHNMYFYSLKYPNTDNTIDKKLLKSSILHDAFPTDAIVQETQSGNNTFIIYPATSNLTTKSSSADCALYTLVFN